jgi:hypothetical protein
MRAPTGARGNGPGWPQALDDRNSGCGCPTLSMALRLTEGSLFSNDLTVVVYPGRGAGRDRFTSGSNFAYLYERDVEQSSHSYIDPVTKRRVTTYQITAAHEFGHQLGLEHPGQDRPPGQRPRPNSDPDYEADAESLMGLGTQMRAHYFAKWRDMLNEANGRITSRDGRPLGGCGPWTIIDGSMPR